MNEPTPTGLIETPALPDFEPPPRIDVAFSLLGERVPAEHGYGLFGAMCRALGDLHGAAWLSVHPIRGVSVGDGTLGLRPHNLALRLRIDPAELSRVLPLAGTTLRIEGHPVTVGVARVFVLEPAPELRARMVVLQERLERTGFERSLQRRLLALGVSATVEIPTLPDAGARPDTDGRRVLRIRGQTITGYSVVLRDLSARDSLRVQTWGVGGRQRFGCGVFSQICPGG